MSHAKPYTPFRVWSEPSVLDKVSYEFAETEEFLKTAEDLTCPYQVPKKSHKWTHLCIFGSIVPPAGP